MKGFTIGRFTIYDWATRMIRFLGRGLHGRTRILYYPCAFKIRVLPCNPRLTTPNYKLQTINFKLKSSCFY
jgi:hypothetical protein